MIKTVDGLKAHVICIVKPLRRNVLHVYAHVVCFVENNSWFIPLDVSLLPGTLLHTNTKYQNIIFLWWRDSYSIDPMPLHRRKTTDFTQL